MLFTQHMVWFSNLKYITENIENILALKVNKVVKYTQEWT